MTTLFRSASPCCELLEPRLQFSGAGDLVHTTGPALAPRLQAIGVSNGSKAIFAGGWLPGPGQGLAGPYSGLDSRSVDVYDSANGSWSVEHLSYGRSLSSAVTVGDKTYLFGGYSVLSGPSAEIDVYDGQTDTPAPFIVPESSYFAIAANVGGRALGAGEGFAASTAHVFDAASATWSPIRLPHPIDDLTAASVTSGNWTLIASVLGGNLFNSVTGHWTATGRPPFANGQREKGVAVGSKAFVLDYLGHVRIYDFVTGRWSTTRLPLPRTDAAVGAAGSKVMFAGGIPTNSVGADPMPMDRIDVYDVLTGRWSQTALAAPAEASIFASAGKTAIFALGTAIWPSSFTNPELFTDSAPTPLFTGSLSGHPGHAAHLTLFNTGDADLTAPYAVEIFASPDRTLKNAISLGRLHVTAPLPAGASTSLQIPTAIPRSPHGGPFFLLAAVRDAHGRLTPVAASETSFRVNPSSAAWG